ncbi:MAG TPA: glycosyltransferase family 39 protein, partial [Candidatus Polarisedimenticolia bacterium]|nr:glycosyltransferase family 39 protein [Candidatus Polarisedimenticolia bacterium]
MSAENTTRPAQPQQGYSGRERLVTRRCLLVVFLAALCVRGLAGWYAGAAQPQEVRYITIARGILTGQGFTGLDTRFPDIIQPPLFPLILSVVQRLPAPDLAMARGASILLGALLVFPAAALSRRIFGEQTARRSAALVAVHPLLVHVSSAAITESTFTLLVVLGALGIWSGAESPGRRALAPVLGAGLLFGGAFLTRPEGLAYLAMSLLVLIVVRARQPEARRDLPILSACLLGAFVLLVTPYTVWVHARLGQWLLAPKAVLVQVHQALVQEGQREMWKEPYGSVLFFERVKFGLNADATAIRSHEQFATAGASLRDGLLVSEEGDVTVSDPGVAARMVARNLKEFYLETVKYGYVLPSVIMILAGIGLLSRPWTGRFPQAALITIAFFLASFSFLLSHVESRFLFTSLPFALPWAAEGWRRTEV